MLKAELYQYVLDMTRLTYLTCRKCCQESRVVRLCVHERVCFDRNNWTGIQPDDFCVLRKVLQEVRRHEKVYLQYCHTYSGLKVRQYYHMIIIGVNISKCKFTMNENITIATRVATSIESTSFPNINGRWYSGLIGSTRV